MNRRAFLTGLLATVAVPALVRGAIPPMAAEGELYYFTGQWLAFSGETSVTWEAVGDFMSWTLP